jgi:hypothetical protein
VSCLECENHGNQEECQICYENHIINKLRNPEIKQSIGDIKMSKAGDIIPYSDHDQVIEILSSDDTPIQKAQKISNYAFEYASLVESDWRERNKIRNVESIRDAIIERER